MAQKEISMIAMRRRGSWIVPLLSLILLATLSVDSARAAGLPQRVGDPYVVYYAAEQPPVASRARPPFLSAVASEVKMVDLQVGQRLRNARGLLVCALGMGLVALVVAVAAFSRRS
jgi:hypothetical protein